MSVGKYQIVPTNFINRDDGCVRHIGNTTESKYVEYAESNVPLISDKQADTKYISLCFVTFITILVLRLFGFGILSV